MCISIYIFNVLYHYQYYNIICVIIFLLFAGCGVIVGRHNILPCAAPFKSLQGLGVPFSFLSFK